MPPLRTLLFAFAIVTTACMAGLYSPSVYAATILVPSQQPTIQAGLDAAVNGDTIEVAAGTYYENINFNGKTVKLCAPSGAALTTIDGSMLTNGANWGSTIILRNGEGTGTEIRGFTITGGSGSLNVDFDLGFATTPVPYGGGIYMYQSSLRLVDCHIKECVATMGSALCAYDYPCLEIEGCTVDSNVAVSRTTMVALVGTELTVDNLLVQSNDSTEAPLGCWFQATTATVQRSSFEDQQLLGTYQDIGGGLFMGSLSTPIVEQDVSIVDCYFARNQLGGRGAGAALVDGTYEVRRCKFEDHPGNAVVLYHSSVDFRRCIFSGNSAGFPAAITALLGDPSEFVAEQCTFTKNTSLDSIIDTIPTLPGTTPSGELRSSIVWDNTAPSVFTGNVTASYSTIEGGSPGTGNLALDPLFADPQNGLYALRPGSPCIDSGDPQTPLDPNGSLPDMGAIPYTHLFVRSDANVDGTITIADAVRVLDALFGATPAPLPCEDAADSNDSGAVEIADAVAILTFLFGNGAPTAAITGCDIDETPDALSCVLDPGCP